MTVALHSGVYTDLHGLTSLKAKADHASPGVLQEAAAQFESLFINMMLKSMRDASLSDGLFDNDSSRLYQGMFDQQMALSLARRPGLGLADIIVRQLSQSGVAPALNPSETNSQPSRPHAAAFDNAEAFVNALKPAAQAAAHALGVSPKMLLAQAALETGWGQKMMSHPDGRHAHNVFGIKADQRWQGETVTVPTVEYRQGVAVKTSASFRAYASYTEAFADYVNFIKTNPRYEEALSRAPDAEGYMSALHQAGYATDPEYYNKIKEIYNGERLGNV